VEGPLDARARRWRTPCWSAKPTFLHVQFNFGFFEFGRLAEVLDRSWTHRGVS